MTIKRFFAILFILAAAAGAWFGLAIALHFRTDASCSRLGQEVVRNWGPELSQEPPVLFYEAPTAGLPRREFAPSRSQVEVKLHYDPKQKGLLWYRTYTADFHAEYLVKNPTPIDQTIYVTFHFPSSDARYDQFALTLGEKKSGQTPINGQLRESIVLAPGAEAPLTITYRAAGVNQWMYALTKSRRVQDLHLAMTTDFHEINTPAGAESPTSRAPAGSGWNLHWDYTDVIGANAIAMDMPRVANPGEVAGRITFFAPVSLVFYFSVLVLLSLRDRVSLHPMNYAFLAGGCFAFQLLFAYLVDLLPLTLSFAIASAVSLALVTGYLWRAAGARLGKISALAQFAYMVLFSYSFFFDGLTGITITIGAIVTLALLMAATARFDWSQAFALPPRKTPPPIPRAV